MYPNLVKSLFAAAAIAGAAIALGSAQAASPASHRADGMRDVYSDGARAASVNAFTDGARSGRFDTFTDGARIAGLDRSGVSADPARNVDPFVDGAQKLAGMDTRGVSASPARSFNVYQDGADA